MRRAAPSRALSCPACLYSGEACVLRLRPCIFIFASAVLLDREVSCTDPSVQAQGNPLLRLLISHACVWLGSQLPAHPDAAALLPKRLRSGGPTGPRTPTGAACLPPRCLTGVCLAPLTKPLVISCRSPLRFCVALTEPIVPNAPFCSPLDVRKPAASAKSAAIGPISTSPIPSLASRSAAQAMPPPLTRR